MTFRSAIPSPSIVIDDRNWQQFAPENPLAKVDGMSRGYQSRDYDREPLGTYAAPMSSAMLIPREEMYDRAVELEKTQTRLSDFALRYGVRRKDQNGTNYCWINAPTWACELMTVLQGQEYVPLSPASGGAKIKNFRNQGGWGDQACDWISKHGLVPVSMWPANAISRQYDKDEAWTVADRYVLTEWEEMPPDNLDYALSCYLRKIPVPIGLSWWRHLVCGCDVVVNRKPKANAQGKISDAELRSAFSTRIANSWKESWGDRGFGILAGSRQVADGQCAVRSMRLISKGR